LISTRIVPPAAHAEMTKLLYRLLARSAILDHTPDRPAILDLADAGRCAANLE